MALGYPEPPSRIGSPVMRALLSNRSVLVVDDDRQMARLLRQLLASLGARSVRTVVDGAAAQTAIVDDRPEIVIAGLEMTPISGIELAKWIRRSDDVILKQTGILLTTANPETSLLLEARDAGVDQFLAKPIDLGRLERKLDALTSKRRPFVDNAGYVGPNRRSGGRAETYKGPMRRRDDGDSDTEELAI